jgi:hypothetical protein
MKDLDGYAKDSYKKYTEEKIPGTPSGNIPQPLQALEKTSTSIPFRMVLSHELCNIESSHIQDNLLCAFRGGNEANGKIKQRLDVKQLFMVREPLSRAISVYYFWGELSKLMIDISHARNKNNPKKGRHKKKPASRRYLLDPILGRTTKNHSVESGMFRYHGVESSVPPLEYAMDFAVRFPYRSGMPGPSLTWSAFANNVEDAIKLISSDRMHTLVLERLEESLIVAVHFLGWSLADVVVTMTRKALSSHPKHHQWPHQATDQIHEKLDKNGEYLVYNASVRELDRKIAEIKKYGVNFTEEVHTLRHLKKRVTQVRFKL